jgi:nucleotide-binding universal stress UspA family protein
MKILIGYDGSDCADAALDDLSRAGLPVTGEAVVMSVAEVWLPPPSAYEVMDNARSVQLPDEPMYAKAKAKAQEAFEQAQRACERLKSRFPSWQVTAEYSSGSPAWEIIGKADAWKPDLIVVGSHGRSALARLVLGSVAQRVVTEARCSVRVSRGRLDEPDTSVRVIVGLDGSPGSEKATSEIARRSWPEGSEFRLVVANDPLSPTFMAELIPGIAKIVDESNEEDRNWVEKLLARGAGVLQNAGLKVSTVVTQGDPKRVLVEEATEWTADCIFVGSTGFSNRLERFVLGSVSASVVARAGCSVEVVR